jgi:dipeptidyl aminopeptidase/acylaminoacyl peptidase
MQIQSRWFPVYAALFALVPAFAADAPTPARPKANYELAAQWTPTKAGKLVFDTTVTPHWLEQGDRFWYSFENSKGRRFYIVDPAKKTKAFVFDPVKLASQLTVATGMPYDSQHLPITTIKFVKNDTTIQFELAVPKDAVIPGEKKTNTQTSTEAAGGNGNGQGQDQDDPQQQGGRGGRGGGLVAGRNEKILYFEYELGANKLTLLDERPQRKPAWASVSPDGKTVVFARNHNLWMMDADNYAKALKDANDKSIVETQLTKDGIEDFGYGGGRGMGGDQQQQDQNTNTEGDQNGQNTRTRQAAGVSWARDSKKFAMVRRDSTKVEKLWVINALANPRPTLETYRYAMPGDINIPQSQLEIFDVAAKDRKIFKVEAFKDQTIQIQAERPTATEREHDKTETLWAAPGSAKLYFTRMSRDLHRLDVCSIDTTSGAVTPLIQERMNVYIEDKPLKFIDNGAAMIWWSERDGWGHYYLYGSDGTLKNQIDKGEFVAEELVSVDEKTRTMTMTADGREDGENPYYMHSYRASLDGNGMKLLDPGDASHAVNMNDAGKYFVDNSSRVNTAPQGVLYDAAGAEVMPLEKVDMTRMLEAGYHFPEPFKVKADDGITDIYGVMYKPFDFDPNKKYPLIEYVYPGPQTESVDYAFNARSNNAMLANFGFIVITVGNRGGNPNRSKWYHTFGYNNLRDYGLADKKAAAEQLAEKHPFIDIERVGMWGHSGGGFMTAAALLVYPDFFKVGWSESGNHENNIYNNTWSEKHHGLKELTDSKGNVTFEYSIDKNSEIAKNLKGHLALITGDIDNNVHPSNTYRLADALIKANKRFDFIILPGMRHPYAADTDYINWRRADFFCQYLLGDFDQTVDMWELNREQQNNGKNGTRVTAGATTTGTTTTTTTTGGGRGGRGGRGGGGGNDENLPRR